MTAPPKKKGHKARDAALQVAFAAQHKGLSLQAALNQELSRQELSPRDRPLITELSYGYLRLKGRIAYILSRYCPGASSKLPPRYLEALGLAVYELLFLDTIPHYATLDVTVQRIKKYWGKQLAGLANALLRRILAQKAELGQFEFYQESPVDLEIFLSRYYSCPQWLVQIFLDSLGPEKAETVLKQSLHSPPVGVRINRTHSKAHDLFRRLRFHDEPLTASFPVLSFRKSPEHIAWYERRGLCSRQSPAAQEALSSLQPLEWPRPVWDACCGFGGKTCQLLESGLSPIWAGDRSPGKVQSCRREIQRLALPEVPLLCADATHKAPFSRPPGTVLLDAPCSGLGVLSRRPDIKWKQSPAAVRDLMRIQAELLRSACETINSGGQIVYLTCTLNNDENRGLIASFSERYHKKIDLVQEYETPFETAIGEYFYAAVLRKK